MPCSRMARSFSNEGGGTEALVVTGCKSSEFLNRFDALLTAGAGQQGALHGGLHTRGRVLFG